MIPGTHNHPAAALAVLQRGSVALLLAILLLVSMAACGESPADGTSDETQDETNTTPRERARWDAGTEQTAGPGSAASPHPLCRAITGPEPVQVRELIAANEDVNARICSGNPPLYTAVDTGYTVDINMGYLEIVQILVDAGADVNAKDNEDNPLLYTAIRRGHPEIVQVLVDAGADVNAKDYEDNPLLYTAITRGHPEIVQILVDAGADVNARERWGESLVRIAFKESVSGTASEEQDYEIVRILVDAGAEVDFPPHMPEIRVIDRSDSSLTIRVAASGGVETHYAVHRRNATESGEWVAMEVPGMDSHFEDRGLNEDSTYYYALRACNAIGCSGLSNETGGVTETAGQVDPPAVPSLSAENGGL